MSDRLQHWREVYQDAPPNYKPIIATLGKLIKHGENITTQDISPDEMKIFGDFVGIKINVPTCTSKIMKWGITQPVIDLAENNFSNFYNDYLLQNAAKFFDCEPSPTNVYVNLPSGFVYEMLNYDFATDFENWLAFLRDVYRRVYGTDDADIIAKYGILEKNNKAFGTEFNGLLLNVTKIIYAHDDLFNRFLNSFAAFLPFHTVKNYFCVEFWQDFNEYTCGSILMANDYTHLVFLKTKTYNFFKNFLEIYGVFDAKNQRWCRADDPQKQNEF